MKSLLLAALVAVAPLACSAQASSAASSPSRPVMHASGTFEVKLAPQSLAIADPLSTLGRMSIDKTFAGDLQGRSQGEMLTAGTAVKGSAAYVAIERFTGSLAGRSGSFALHHTGVMDRGAPRLSVVVVPDSGTGELAGLTGTMTIDITGGKHLYTFDYQLP